MIYLDNAATSFPKPASVVDAVTHAINRSMGTPGRGNHFSALHASDTVNGARKAFTDFFGVRDYFRMIFTYSATDALNMALKGFLNSGDRVLISEMEHNSVLRPLRAMERRGEIELDIIRCDDEGYLDLEDLQSKLKKSHVRLTVLAHGSNVTGAVQDIAAAGKIIRENGSYLLLDAAQTAGVTPIHGENMNVDMLAFAGHKHLYGLQGTGGLILGSRMQGLRPFREGGTGFDSQSETQPVNWPEAFESGTHNVPGIVSMAAGLRFIQETGMENIRKKEDELVNQLINGLAGYDNIVLHTPRSGRERSSLVSFTVNGWDSQDVGDILNRNHDIHLRTGLHCSALAHKRLGTFPEGTVRVSPGYFNNGQDINSFLKAVDTIAGVKAIWY